MELRIDEVAKLTGLTKRTIRYYEEIGLIAPGRTQGGYRLYGERDIEQLRKVLVAKEVLGFSLQELLQYMNLSDSIQQHKSNYRSTSDRDMRKSELMQIADGLRQEMDMIDQKMKRMEQFKQELADMHGRVLEVLREYAE